MYRLWPMSQEPYIGFIAGVTTIVVIVAHLQRLGRHLHKERFTIAEKALTERLVELMRKRILCCSRVTVSIICVTKSCGRAGGWV